MAASPQQMFNEKMLKLLELSIIPESRMISEVLTAEYIHDHRYDARLINFFETKLNHDKFVEALLKSKYLTLKVLTSHNLFEAIRKGKNPNPWKKILDEHLSEDPKFFIVFISTLSPYGHFDEIMKSALSYKDQDPKEKVNPDFKPRPGSASFQPDPGLAPRSAAGAASGQPAPGPAPKRAAGPGAGAAGAGAGFVPGFDRARAQSGAKPAPSAAPAPKREFSAFEEAMGRADYLDTKAHKRGMEERKQHQEDKMKMVIIKYVEEGVDIYKPFGTKAEFEKMSPAAFKRKFAELISAPGDKNLELLTNAKEILLNPAYKAYYDRKVSEKAARRARPA